MKLDWTFQTHLLRTSSGPHSGPQVTNQGYPGLSPTSLQVHVTVYALEKNKNMMHTTSNMTNMQKYALSQGPTLLMVPLCLTAAGG